MAILKQVGPRVQTFNRFSEMPARLYTIPLIAVVLLAQTACLADYPDDQDNALPGLLIAAALNAGPFTAARVSRTSAQSVPNATATAVAFEQVDFGTNNLTGGGASGGLSTPTDGLYLISGGPTALQAIPNATLTSVIFESADFDTAGYFNAAQPDRLTISEAGVYLVVANSELEVAGVAGTRGVELLVNGTRVVQELRAAIGSGNGTLNLMHMQQFNAGDTVQV